MKSDYSIDFKIDYQRLIITHSKCKAHKRYSCCNCFSLKDILTTHIKSVQTKESEYKCEVCETLFTQRSFLLNHVKTVHHERFELLFLLNVINRLLKTAIL